MTPQQYLEIERKAEYKSEYFDGKMVAMARANVYHNRLTMDLAFVLYPQVEKCGCELYASNMRVRVSATGLYTYLDVLVVCAEQQLLDSYDDTLLNPCFIIEVMSPATAAYDRGGKSDHYRTLESLRGYLLIEQDRRHAELYTRQQDGRWSLTEAGGDEDILELRSINCRIGMAEIYEDT